MNYLRHFSTCNKIDSDNVLLKPHLIINAYSCQLFSGWASIVVINSSIT